jgi:DNA-binding transcriptional regulator YiaG
MSGPTKETVPFRGLQGVRLHGISKYTCASCGAHEHAIPAIEKLHAVIAAGLWEKAGPLSGLEARFLRKHIGWSKEDLAHRMGVSADDVARWEGSSTNLPPHIDAFLRVLARGTSPVTSYEELAKRASSDTCPNSRTVALQYVTRYEVACVTATVNRSSEHPDNWLDVALDGKRSHKFDALKGKMSNWCVAEA